MLTKHVMKNPAYLHVQTAHAHTKKCSPIIERWFHEHQLSLNPSALRRTKIVFWSFWVQQGYI